MGRVLLEEKLQGSLAGLETLALEQNDAWRSYVERITSAIVAKEFKWADFFGRHITRQPFCLLGVASLFLVAADITAFAAAAEGGEHVQRVDRALLFASRGFSSLFPLGELRQGLARQHVESQGTAAARDLFRWGRGL